MRSLVCGFAAMTLGILQVVSNVKGTLEGYYSVVGTCAVQSALDYNVAVAVYDTKQPVKMKIRLDGPTYNETQTVELSSPKEPKLVKFKLPKLEEGDYNLAAEGIEGLKFQNTTKLYFKKHKGFINVHLAEERIYYPGETLNYSVLLLDKDLKPIGSKNHQLIITYISPRNVPEVKKVETTDDVYRGTFEIPKNTTLGYYDLIVNTGTEIEPKSARVKFWVRNPLDFNIDIELPKEMSIYYDDPQIVVSANYHNGTKVAGKVDLLLNVTRVNVKNFTANMVNGKAKFPLNLKPFLQDKPYMNFFSIAAIVEQNPPGVKKIKTVTKDFNSFRYTMNCAIEICNRFHADKEESVSFKITHLNGSFIKDTTSMVRVKYIMNRMLFPRGSRCYGPICLRHHLIQEKSGNQNALQSKNKIFVFEGHLNESGIVTFKVKIDSEPVDGLSYYIYKVELEFKDEKRIILKALPYTADWRKEINQFHIIVHQGRLREKFKLDDEVKLTFKSPKLFKYFIYNIIGRGTLLETKRIEFEEPRREHKLTLKLTFQMIPTGRIFAYYVDDKGEFHYSEQVFGVKLELQNKTFSNALNEVKQNLFGELLPVEQNALSVASNFNLTSQDFHDLISTYDMERIVNIKEIEYPTLPECNFFAAIKTMSNTRFIYKYMSDN